MVVATWIIITVIAFTVSIWRTIWLLGKVRQVKALGRGKHKEAALIETKTLFLGYMMAAVQFTIGNTGVILGYIEAEGVWEKAANAYSIGGLCTLLLLLLSGWAASRLRYAVIDA